MNIHRDAHTHDQGDLTQRFRSHLHVQAWLWISARRLTHFHKMRSFPLQLLAFLRKLSIFLKVSKQTHTKFLIFHIPSQRCFKRQCSLWRVKTYQCWFNVFPCCNSRSDYSEVESHSFCQSSLHYYSCNKDNSPDSSLY